MTPKYAVAQLRHLYKILKTTSVAKPVELADKLLSPAIQALELAQMQPTHERIAQEALFMGYDQLQAELNAARGFQAFANPELEAHHSGYVQGLEAVLKRFEPYLKTLKAAMEKTDAEQGR